MITMQKLRSCINAKMKEVVSPQLVKYKLRTVAKVEKHGYTVIDVEHFEIAETLRNEGLGKKVLNIIIETMLENKVDCIVITASDMYGTDFNKLVHLYKSLGFKEITGGVRGCMYMLNSETDSFIQRLAEYNIIESSRMQRVNYYY